MSTSEPNPGDESAENRPSPEKRSFFDRKLSERPEKFEDFNAWQESRRLANRLYEVTDKAEFATDAGVREGIRQSIVQVMSQLAAAVESGSEREFSRGLQQARSSAATVRSLLFIAIDRNYLTEQESTELVGRSASIGRIIGSQLARLKRAETEEFKRKGGRPGFGGKPGGFGQKKPFGSKPGGFGPKKPFRPKRDE